MRNSLRLLQRGFESYSELAVAGVTQNSMGSGGPTTSVDFGR
jgi:hypothetical protein